MTIEGILRAWAKQWKRENLSEAVQKLIATAKYDLWYGPYVPEEGDDYPGFGLAVDAIQEALAFIGLPTVYVSAEREEIVTSDPTEEECYECDGTGTVPLEPKASEVGVLRYPWETEL